MQGWPACLDAARPWTGHTRGCTRSPPHPTPAPSLLHSRGSFAVLMALPVASGWKPLEISRVNGICREAIRAGERVRPFVHQTPVEPSAWLGNGQCQVHIKLESEQRTGSFKARGAVNKVLSRPSEELRKGLVTSSTGNHALAFLYACKCLEEVWPEVWSSMPRPIVYLPKTASEYKVAKLKSLCVAEIVLHGTDCVEAELEAARMAAASGATYISPYNDLEVMAGQGTISLDLMEQLPRSAVDVVFVPVGGGGLISGMAAVLKAADPSIHIVGCQPAASDVMRQSVLAGRILDIESSDTLSDATAGGVEPDALTLAPCMEYVDEWVTVSEEQIGQAVVGCLSNHSKLIEGAAGCAIAAFLMRRDQLLGKSVVVLCCGGNVAASTLKLLLDKHL